MTGEATLKEVIGRLGKAIDTLEATMSNPRGELRF